MHGMKRRHRASTVRSDHRFVAADAGRAEAPVDGMLTHTCHPAEMEVSLYMLCMNPLQSARAKAAAYPLYPDALAIINAVAEPAGAPPATELMRRPPDPVRGPRSCVQASPQRDT